MAGATCTQNSTQINGIMISSNTVRVNFGYFAAPSEIRGQLLTAACPYGYCCNDTAVGCSIGNVAAFCTAQMSRISHGRLDKDAVISESLCSGNRYGRLCGQCLPGYSAAIGLTTDCVPEAECNGMPMYISAVLVFSLLCSLYFYFGEREGGGNPSAVFWYLQMMALLTNLDLSDDAAAVFQLANYQMPNRGRGSDYYACISSGMESTHTNALQMVIPAVILLMLILIALIRATVIMVRNRRNQYAAALWSAQNGTVGSGVKAALGDGEPCDERHRSTAESHRSTAGTHW